jgi:hypothetical protein
MGDGKLLAFTMFPLFSAPITGKCQTFSHLFHRLPMYVVSKLWRLNSFEGVEHFLAAVVVCLDNSDLSCVYNYY